MGGSVSEAWVEALLGDPGADRQALAGAVAALLAEHRKLRGRLERISRISDGYQAQLRELNGSLRRANEDLAATLAEVKTLRGLLPICMHCKSIRDDRGYWNQLEDYVSQHTEAVFSHGICPKCLQDFYPEMSCTPASPVEIEEDPVSQDQLAAVLTVEERDEP